MQYYYTSPTGTGDGLSVGSPCSLAYAKAQAPSASASDDVTVYMLAGRYALSSTFAFTSADSGQGGHTIYWASYDPENPAVLSGGIQITDWTLHDAGKNIWKATVPTGLYARQCYVNGVRATRSRLSDTLLNSVTKITAGYFRIISAAMPTFAYPLDLEVETIGTSGFVTDRGIVQSLTRVGDTTNFNMDTSQNGFTAFDGTSWVYHEWSKCLALENAYEFLDSTTLGHWYLDTHTDTLYYIPKIGEVMAEAEVILPILKNVCKFTGAADIAFEDIHFSHSKWDGVKEMGVLYVMQANYYHDYRQPQDPFDWSQMEIDLGVGVDLFDSDRITFTRCTFNKMGGRGLRIGQKCTDSYATYCRLHDISGNGLTIGEIDIDELGADPALFAVNCGATYNHIHQIGIEYGGSIGLMIGYTNYCYADYNTIHDLAYTAINLGWGWGDINWATMRGNRVRYNKIYECMQEFLDGGGLYMLGPQGGNYPPEDWGELHDNYIEDTHIYFDWGIDGIRCYNNVVVRSGKPIIPGAAIYTIWAGGFTPERVDRLIGYDNYATEGLICLNNPSWPELFMIDAPTPLPLNSNDWPAAAIAIMNAAGDGGEYGWVPPTEISLTADNGTTTPTGTSANLSGVLTADNGTVQPTATAANLTGTVSADNGVITPTGTEAALEVNTGSGSIRSPSGVEISLYTTAGQPITIYTL